MQFAAKIREPPPLLTNLDLPKEAIALLLLSAPPPLLVFFRQIQVRSSTPLLCCKCFSAARVLKVDQPLFRLKLDQQHVHSLWVGNSKHGDL